MKLNRTLIAGFAVASCLSFANVNAKDKKEETPKTTAELSFEDHPYAADFEQFAISKDYKNPRQPKDLTNEEKTKVNRLILATKDHFISRIGKDGKVDEVQFRPIHKGVILGEKAAKEVMFAYYRADYVLAYARTLLSSHHKLLSESDAEKLLSAIDYAVGVMSKWRLEMAGNTAFSPESLSEHIAEVLLLDQTLKTLTKTKVREQALKKVKKLASKVAKRVEKKWPIEGMPLITHYLDGTPEFSRKYQSAERLLRAITLCPTEANKKRVRIAEHILKMMVESAHLVEDFAVDRFPSVASVDPPRSPKDQSKVKEGKGGESDYRDRAVVWPKKNVPEKYWTGREWRKKLKVFLDLPWPYGLGHPDRKAQNLIFLSALRYLMAPETKKWRTSISKEFVPRARKLAWNVNASLTLEMLGTSRKLKKGFRSFVDVSSLKGTALGADTHSSLSRYGKKVGGEGSNDYSMDSDLEYLSCMASMLHRTTLGNNDWYQLYAKELLSQIGESGLIEFPRKGRKKGSITAKREIFYAGFHALLFLRKQPISKEGEGDSKRPISGEAKPAEEGGNDGDGGEKPKGPPAKSNPDKAKKPE